MRTAIRTRFIWMVVVISVVAVESARAGPPRITAVNPPAVQRGIESTIQIYGKQLSPTGQLILPFPVEVRTIGGSVEGINITLKLPAGTATGVFPLRLRTAEGISNLRLIEVVDVPVVRVQEPNGAYKNGTLDLARTQLVPVPCVIAGNRLERDIDGFRFVVPAGDRLTIVSECWRIGLTPDPLLRLRDARGKMLAYEHDTPTLYRDERLDFKFAESGDHYLELQSTGGGGWNNHYLVKVGPFDYVKHVFPLGGKRGEKLSVEVVNRDGDISRIEAVVPNDPWVDEWRLPLTDYPGSLPWPMACGDYPEVLESADHTEPQALTWPVTVNGRIARPQEVDLYRLAVRPGQKIRVRADAFQLGSALDGYLMAYDPAGQKLIAKHDDQGYRGHMDPMLDFEVPAGLSEVVIALCDTLRQGSPAHAYRLTVEEGGPDFFLWLGNKQQPTNEEDVGWHRMDASDTLNLSVGQEFRLRLSVRRTKADDPHYAGSLLGFDGPITVKALNLPAGVIAKPLVIPGSDTQAELLVTADERAPREPFEIVVVGEATRADGSQIRRIAERRLFLSDPAIPNLPWNWRVQKVACVVK